jgi:hypothetical protein
VLSVGGKALALSEFWPSAAALMVMLLRIILDMTVWNERGAEALTRFKRVGVDFAFAGFSLLSIALTRTNSTFQNLFGKEGGYPYIVTLLGAVILCIVTIVVYNIEQGLVQERRGLALVGQVVLRILLIGVVWTVGVLVFFVAAALV